jgi:aminoglycoside phosphotransferase (APT) family kinase protein
LARLEPHIELVDQLCHLVESIGLPQTLAHGDLDAGNVFVREGVPAIMDWSDVSISSPLFDPALIPQVTGNPILARAYLDEWTEFASMERLEDAFEAARPIAALERAFHYHRNIVAHLTYPSVDLRILEEYIPDLLNLAASRLEEYG